MNDLLARNLDVDLDQIADFCRRHHIRWLAVFGSALRDDFSPESDVDVLVELEPGTTMGLAYVGLADELSPFFGGRRVDLGSPDTINRWIRAKVLREAQVLYDEIPSLLTTSPSSTGDPSAPAAASGRDDRLILSRESPETTVIPTGVEGSLVGRSRQSVAPVK